MTNDQELEMDEVSQTREVSATPFTPTVRMVRLCVTISPDCSMCREVQPVVAGVLRHTEEWTQLRPKGAGAAYYPRGNRQSDWLEAGWRFEGTDYPVEWIYDVGGFFGAGDGFGISGNCASQIVACAWPPERDDAMFWPIFEQLWRDLIDALEEPLKGKE